MALHTNGRAEPTRLLIWDQESLDRHGGDVDQAWLFSFNDDEDPDSTRWSLVADLRRRDGTPLRMLAIEASLYDIDGVVLDTTVESTRPSTRGGGIATTSVHLFSRDPAGDRPSSAGDAPDFTAIAKVRPGGPPPQRKPVKVPARFDRPALASAGYRHVKAQATCQAAEWDGTINVTVAVSATFDGDGAPALEIVALDIDGLPVSTRVQRIRLEPRPDADGTWIGTREFRVMGVPGRVIVNPASV